MVNEVTFLASNSLPSNHVPNHYHLSADNLVGVRGDRLLFKQLNFNLPSGTVLYLQGENGSGKTTLLRTICGLAKPYEGQIKWCGEDISALAEEYSKHVLYIGHLPGIKEDLTAIENLQFSLTLSGSDISADKAIETLKMLGLGKCLNLPTRMLSQGQKRRVALARLWLQALPLWILDEPFTALDALATDVLKQKIEAFANNGGIVVMTTHQQVTLNVPNLMQLKLDS